MEYEEVIRVWRFRFYKQELARLQKQRRGRFRRSDSIFANLPDLPVSKSGCWWPLCNIGTRKLCKKHRRIMKKNAELNRAGAQ